MRAVRWRDTKRGWYRIESMRTLGSALERLISAPRGESLPQDAVRGEPGTSQARFPLRRSIGRPEPSVAGQGDTPFARATTTGPDSQNCPGQPRTMREHPPPVTEATVRERRLRARRGRASAEAR